MSNLLYLIAFITQLLILIDFSESSNLDDFLKSYEDADLNFDFKTRKKRNPSIDELLSRFEENDYDESNVEAGDAWYQSFRALECRHGGCQKIPLRWKSKKALPEDDYEDYDNEEEPIILQDQWENTKNDLSHEANYKLSKMEQDAVERNLPKTAWPVHHSNMKREVNPMHAVKLLTSLKMLEHGEGPVLPSSFLESDVQDTPVDGMLGFSKEDLSADPWKEDYEVMESRKLLSVEESDDAPVVSEKKLCAAKNCLKHVFDIDQFDNMNQKNDFDRKFEGLSFDNLEDKEEKEEKERKAKKGTLASIGDSIMKSEAFVKLHNFLKGKKNDKKETETNKTKKTESDTTTGRPTTSSPLNLVDKDGEQDGERDVNIKLRMSVNATVLGDKKLPEQFHKNNTITFKPRKEAKSKKSKKKKKVRLDSEDDDNRRRRGVVFPILTSTSKRRAKEEVSKSVGDATENFPLDELITGKLTSQLVTTIFSLVKSSPSLKVLWPGLRGNKVASPKQVQNFYAIRNKDNESEMHRTELMLLQAMETINAIIEQQVRSRSCVPLRADLKAFYNLILETQAQNRQFQDRRKRETFSETNSDNHPDASEFRQKSRIVKKLLKDFEELPVEDQERISNIRDNLLLASEELKELELASRRRRKRQLFATLNRNLTSNIPDTSQYTPEFLKLSRTAEMLLHSAVQDDPDMSVDFDNI